MRDKGGAVALVAEAPDDAGVEGLEVAHALGGDRIGEIGDRVETADRQPGIAI